MPHEPWPEQPLGQYAKAGAASAARRSARMAIALEMDVRCVVADLFWVNVLTRPNFRTAPQSTAPLRARRETV